MLYFAFVGGPFCKIFLKSVQATIGDGIVPPETLFPGTVGHMSSEGFPFGVV